MSSPRTQPPAAGAVRVTAIHVSGVHGLAAGATVELRFSDAGLQILRIAAAGSEPVGRLSWTEVSAFRLVKARRVLRRTRPRLVLTSAAGQACFELPALTAEQMHAYLRPFARRTGAPRRGS